jgi:glycosyltransferase involved in cell wall biosynthesis
MSAHILVALESLPHPIDTRVRAQVEALVEAGHRVTVAGPTGNGHHALEEALGPVRVVRYRPPPPGDGVLGYAREFGLGTLRLARLVARVHRERPVDLLLACNPPDVLAALGLLLRRHGTRVLMDQREICPELFEAKFGRRGLPFRALLAAERLGFRCADAAITVSEPCVRIARERGRMPADRVFLVGNGPDPRRIFPVEPRPELRGGRRHLVLWLGAMSHQEGLEVLVDAAEHVVRRGRDDVRFAIVGPGDVRESLRADVARRGLAETVDIPGAVGDDVVRAYMSTAAVCVGVDTPNAMNDRAAMRKVLEYMAVGRPVVQFPLAEMRRLCGETTEYARPGDAADLADRIVALLDDPARRSALGEAGRRRVADGLLWPQQVPALLAAVDATLSRPERRPGRARGRRAVAAEAT